MVIRPEAAELGLPTELDAVDAGATREPLALWPEAGVFWTEPAVFWPEAAVFWPEADGLEIKPNIAEKRSAVLSSPDSGSDSLPLVSFYYIINSSDN